MGNCYKYTDRAYPWTEARDFCVENGGDLASIPDQETNDFLFSIISSRAFIGGILDSSSGAWTWSDGTLFSFTKWKSNQPSGDGPVQEMFEDGTWNDLPTSGYPRPALCQKQTSQTWIGEGQ